MSDCHNVERYNFNMLPGIGIGDWMLKPGVNCLIEVFTINNSKDICIGAYNTLVSLTINY